MAPRIRDGGGEPLPRRSSMPLAEPYRKNPSPGDGDFLFFRRECYRSLRSQWRAEDKLPPTRIMKDLFSCLVRTADFLSVSFLKNPVSGRDPYQIEMVPPPLLSSPGDVPPLGKYLPRSGDEMEEGVSLPPLRIQIVLSRVCLVGSKEKIFEGSKPFLFPPFFSR